MGEYASAASRAAGVWHFAAQAPDIGAEHVETAIAFRNTALLSVTGSAITAEPRQDRLQEERKTCGYRKRNDEMLEIAIHFKSPWLV